MASEPVVERIAAILTEALGLAESADNTLLAAQISMALDTATRETEEAS